MPDDETVTVKLKFGGKLRRIRLPPPIDKTKIYHVLLDSNYPEYKEVLPVDNLDHLELSFCDEEGDRVNLSDPRDFADAADFFREESKIPCFLVVVKAPSSADSASDNAKQLPAATEADNKDQLPNLRADAAPSLLVAPSTSTDAGNLGLLGVGGAFSSGAFGGSSAFSAGSVFGGSAFGSRGAVGGGTTTGLGADSGMMDSVGLGGILGEGGIGELLRDSRAPVDGTSHGTAGALGSAVLNSPDASSGPSSSVGVGGAPSQRGSSTISSSAPSYEPLHARTDPGAVGTVGGDMSSAATFGKPKYDFNAASYEPSGFATSAFPAHTQASQSHSFQQKAAFSTFSPSAGEYVPKQQNHQNRYYDRPKPEASLSPRSQRQGHNFSRRNDQYANAVTGKLHSSGSSQSVAATGSETQPLQNSQMSPAPGGWASIAAGAGSSSTSKSSKPTTSTKSSSPPTPTIRKAAAPTSAPQISSFLDPVYPDELFSEKDNAIAIRQHEEQGLNPTIIKYLFKGATTDKMSGDKNGKLILLGRDGDVASGKFWMLKSDGADIYLVDPRESYHVLVKSPRGGYVRVRHEPFEYRYNFEFVPHPKMSHKKSGRYFVKYRRNAYIRQYFCEIRKNHEEDDAALVFKVERIP